MQQCVYAVEVVQYLEFLLQNLLDIRTPERADAVSFSGSRLDPLLELEALRLGQPAGSTASGSIGQSRKSIFVVTPYPLLHHAARHAEQRRRVHCGVSLFG